MIIIYYQGKRREAFDVTAYVILLGSVWVQVMSILSSDAERKVQGRHLHTNQMSVAAQTCLQGLYITIQRCECARDSEHQIV